MDRRRAAAVAATTLSGALLLPGVAAAQPEIPPVPMDAHHPNACSAIKATYRVTVAQARADKQTGYAAATAAWLRATADEKRQLTRSLATADTKRRVKIALRTYRAETADERAARAEARRSARLEFRESLQQAKQIYRASTRNCR